MKKYRKWGCGLLAVVLVTAISSVGMSSTMAALAAGAQEEGAVPNSWIDENLGPGVAKWVDENGNVTDQTGAQAKDGSGQEAAGQQQEAGEGSGQLQAGSPQEEAGQAGDQNNADAQGVPQNQTSGRQLDPSKPMVALTFDDGPYGPVGNQIMDSLAQYGGKATFFVVGDRVSSYKAEMQRMAAEGHEIGNHTYNHKYLTKLNAAQIQEQISKCNDAVEAVCGVRPALVRLPGGLKNSTVLANINAPIIMWSIDTLDWKTRNAGKTVNAVMGKVRDGDIVLMHELYSQSGAAAVEIIPRLTEAGYQLVTVSELAQYRGGLAAGKIYSSFYR